MRGVEPQGRDRGGVGERDRCTVLGARDKADNKADQVS